MKLYNTLGREIQTFKPLNDQNVLMYSCGPTVYDYMHIGNLRKFVFDDTLRRALQANNFNVQHTMNITDVGHLVSDDDEGQDKLEKGAQREGKTVWQVADHYIDAFQKDVGLMNILPPNKHQGDQSYSRATNFVSQQIEMVEVLLQKGFAYQTKQAIYFDVTKLPDYGLLTGQKLADKEIAVRKDVVSDTEKHHPQDFALWFFTVGRFANHDMHWDNPRGQGFPGWHLECSAIIHSVLGDPIDIHTGGVDNIGTHHVNEMAQTEAAYGNKLANYWIHAEHLLVDGERMAKSSGNYYTLADITKKGFDPMALRLLYLQSHYRTQMNFSWENLEAANNRLKDFYAWADLKHQPSAPAITTELDELFRDTRQVMTMALADDLNTPAALSALGKLVSYMQAIPIPAVDGKYTADILGFLDNLLGLNLDNRPDISPQQKQLLKERQAARDAKDWSKSDQLRTQLEEQGLDVRDTNYGPQWSRR